MYSRQRTLIFYLFIGCVNASGIGDQISQIVRKFADEGLGTGEMQKYVNNSVTFENETIDAKTVKQIATNMAENIERHASLLRTLQNDLENTTLTSDVQLNTKNYYTCCNIRPQGKSNIHGKNVNLEEWCLQGDSLRDNIRLLTPEMMDKFKDIYTRAGDIKYVYFGSEEGVLYNYPGIQNETCDSYDPRFRPWYVETIAPTPKDVVIVIERSNAMQYDSSVGVKTLIEVATEAASGVLDTLNLNDRVGIVTFSEEAETPSGGSDMDGRHSCYSTTLARANSYNRNYLKSFLDRKDAAGAGHYNKALKKAFEYFTNTPDDIGGRSRDKVLLFLAGGKPNDEDAPKSVYNTLRDLNGQLNNSVVVLTYYLTTAQEDDIKEVLQNMALQTFSNSSFGSIRAGQFTFVDKHETPETIMAAYYRVLGSGNTKTDLTFSALHLDTFLSPGVLISMCLPVKQGENVTLGVVCVDQLADDFLSEVTYFRKGTINYAFIIDGNSHVLSHPLLAHPVDITNLPASVELKTLESGSGIEDIHQSMLRGEIGEKHISSRRVIARGSLDTEGVKLKKVESTYYWHPVNGSSFTVCIVKSQKENSKKVKWNSNYPSVFNYHKNSIASPPSETCKYFAREALKGQGNVKFAPRSFLDPYAYILGDETTSDSEKYNMHFTGQSNNNTWFRPEVRDHVAFSFKFEELMESRQVYGDYAVWRYFGTEEGVVRLYPGVEISTMYDPSLRSWYVRAMSSPSLYSISTPYLDAFGAGIVITLSKAILGRSGGAPVGVMGVDFTMPYFYYLLTQGITDCTNYQCLFIDSSGFVVLNSNWFGPSKPEIKNIEGIHISSVEPEITEDLESAQILHGLTCINIRDLREQNTWRISSKEKPNSWYEIHEIKATNMYLLIKKGSPGKTEDCYCPSDENNIELCSHDKETCFCPCFKATDHYNYCTGEFKMDNGAISPCSPPIPSVDFSHLTLSEKQKIETMEPCRDYKCGERHNREQCVSVVGCTWCDREEDKKTFCGTWGECSLIDDIVTFSPGIFNWTTAAHVISGLLVLITAIAIIGLIIRIVKRGSPRDDSHQLGSIAYVDRPQKSEDESTEDYDTLDNAVSSQEQGTLPNSRTQNDVSVDDVYLHTSSNNAEGSENNLEGISDDTGYLKAMMVGQLSDKLKPDKLVWSSNSHSGLQQ